MSNHRLITVPKDHELRIYVPFDEPIPNPAAGTGASVRLQGDATRRAEVFGAPMMPNTRYFLQRGAVIAIFAWTTATIELCGSDRLLNNTSSTIGGIGASSMPSPVGGSQWWVGSDGMHQRPLAEYHSLLKDCREGARDRRLAAVEAQQAAHAAANNGAASSSTASLSAPIFAGGPRVLICGRESSGKHTAMRTLANYAVRNNMPTTLVDLSTGSQMIGLPGTIASCVAEYPLTPTDINYDLIPHLAYMVGTMAAQPTPKATSYSTGGKTISGAVRHYARLMADRVNERLGPSTTQVLMAGGSLAGFAPAAAGSSVKGANATSQAPVAGAVVVAPNVQGTDGAQFLLDVIEWYGITHVLCIADGKLYATLQKVAREADQLRGGLGDGLGADGSAPSNVIGGVRFDFLCANTAIAPKATAFRDKINEMRCRTHFYGSGLVKFIPIRYRRAHTALSVWQLTVKPEGNAAATAASTDANAAANPFAVKNVNGKVAPVQYDLKGLKGLAGKLCAIVDLTAGAASASHAAGGGAANANKGLASMVQSSLTTAPILCYAQMHEADLTEAVFLAACPQPPLDAIQHMALVAGEYAYTLQAYH